MFSGSFSNSLTSLLEAKIKYCQEKEFDSTPIIVSLKTKFIEINKQISNIPFEGKAIGDLHFHRKLIFKDKGSDYSLIYQIFPMTAIESKEVEYIGLSDIFSNQTNWAEKIQKVLPVDNFLE
jgi:hypothetical protein